MIELVGGDGDLEKGPMTAQPNQNSLAEPSPSPSSTTLAPALVLSNSGKRMDQAGKKKYLKQVTGRHNDTELHLAAQRADLAAVKKILGDIDSQIVGAVSGAEFDTEVAEVRAAVVNEVNELGETALFTAADKGHLDVVKELLKYSNRETVTKKNRSGFDPLHAAANQGHHGETKSNTQFYMFYGISQTYPNPLQDNPSYSVVKQYFVNADDTVAQKIVVHKDSPRGTHFRRSGPRQKVYFEANDVGIISRVL